ncbi:MAG: class I SAM-dependent methyltransferase [Ktedonobacterales bacterium]
MNPAAGRLLELHPGQLTLEIASGNGVFARKLARLGADIVATDFSDQFLERAKAAPGGRLQL